MRLPVDWAALRARLGVARVDDLWRVDPASWHVVTQSEVLAARHAVEMPVVTHALAHVGAFAVLTSNSEAAVEAFLGRSPALAARVAAVVGRETLAGPKTDAGCFEKGFARCVEATAAVRGDDPVVYVGDQDYELAFARSLGAVAVDARTLRGPRP